MCVEPLVRYRLKRNPKDSFFGVSSYFQITSQKKLQALFPSYSAFKEHMDNNFDYQIVPCRRCVECKAQYAQEWSIRCYHESIVRDSSSFITLTIDSSKVHLFFDNMKSYCKKCVKGNRYIKYPIDYTLCKGFILDELKKMRDTLYKRYNISIRYFGCGEYGSIDERPHYHILLFGYNFPDKKFFKNSAKGVPIYISEELSSLWKYGLAIVQDVNHRACMYVSKYVSKKIKFNDLQSEFEMYYGREPEFLFMSKGNCQSNRCPYIDDIIKNCKGLNSLRNLENPYCKHCNKTRGGLGYDWFLKYYKDVLKIGHITIEGVKYPIPKYYLSLLKLTDINQYDKLHINSLDRIDELQEKNFNDYSYERLQVRKKILKRKSELTKRA